MKKRSGHFPFKIYLLLFVLLAAGFGGCQLYSLRASQTLRTYTFTKQELAAPQDSLSLSVTVAKQWDDEQLHPEMPIGAQYDGVLTNGSELAFKNWTAELHLSEELRIDSSWNGDFTVDGSTISFTAVGDPATAPPKGVATFGAVLYSNNLLELEGYTLSGYRIVSLTDLNLFWALVVLSVLWLMALLMHLVVRARTAHFRRQQALDDVIIRQSMNTFTGFIDAKDAYTKGHSVRVAEYSAEIARRMKLPAEQVKQLYYISLMHDCGKLGIPDAVLQKPGPLTAEEFRIIQSHTVTGDAILLNFTAIPGIREGAHFHHERFDGTGYPTGLKGKDIPLCARIICVADSFDAMSSNRCYRKHLDNETIISELQNNAGKQFDPEIEPYMIDMIKDGFVKTIQKKYPSTPKDAEKAE